MSPISDASISKTLQNIFQRGAHFIPDEFTGTGAPGNYLEFLFGVDGGNQDMPDTGNWELKFHGGKSLMTLFHLQSAPRGSLRGLVDDFGWLDAKGGGPASDTQLGAVESPLSMDFMLLMKIARSLSGTSIRKLGQFRIGRMMP